MRVEEQLHSESFGDFAGGAAAGLAVGTPIEPRPTGETATRIASIIPAMFSLGDHVPMRSFAAAARDVRRERSESAPRRIRARASTSPHGYTKSGATGATKSRAAPTLSLAMTGQPQHMASFTTTANASYSELSTIRSAAA